MTSWSDKLAGKPGLLVAILLCGLVVRLVFLFGTAETQLKIVDEQHYHQLATNLVQGNGFAWGPGQLTSMRPPLYPAVIALIWTVTGTDNLIVVRIVQVALSLFTVVLVYLLGFRLYNREVATVAAGLFCLYPSLVGFNFLILTETLFTFLLCSFVLTVVLLLQTGRMRFAWLAGGLLGLAALTRSVMWPFPLLLIPLLLWKMPYPVAIRLKTVGALLLGYLLVMTPWVVRNTQLQHTLTVVDAMGGVTLRMGNYQYTPINRAWDPMTLHGENSIYDELRKEHPDASRWTEGQKDKWAQRKAVAYVVEHPGVTIHRSMIKFASFWGLERTIIAGWQQGLYHPPRWFVWLGTAVIPIAYVLVMLLASFGMSQTVAEGRGVHLFVLLVIAFITAVHTVAFGHPRYHLPLIPFLCIFASAAVMLVEWGFVRRGVRQAIAPVLVCVLWLIIWSRELLVVESERIHHLLSALLGSS
jgi:4-amino-4-deoxy-L-arabinose transferase-like glycosyltransferase